MNFVTASIPYVLADQYFLFGMAMTCIVGAFIGALVYDGVLRQAQKAALTLISYAVLIAITNLARILPLLERTAVTNIQMPLASTITMIFVTIFYTLGMFLGVWVVNHAHGGRLS